MRYSKIEAELLTPCCISTMPAMGNELDSLDYIPGTAVRGMLADTYLRNGNSADQTFRRIFCSGLVRFPNLYPIYAHPLPLSAHTCKHSPGFTSEDDREERHGVWDMLFEDVDGFTCTTANRRQCIKCDGPIKQHTVTWYDGSQINPESITPSPRLLVTRTAIHAASGSALEGSLHSQWELAPGTHFSGLLVTNEQPDLQIGDSLLDTLLDRLGRRSDRRLELMAYTGRRRAGRVRLKVRSSSPPSYKLHFFDPWPGPPDPDRSYFSLTFASDVILLDRLLRPIVTLDRGGHTLRNEMAFPCEVAVTVEKAFARTRPISGWNAVARIFKADDTAIVMGSTFLVSFDKSSKQDVQDWMQSILNRGVGLRRAEGFGQVTFDEPFHKAAENKQGGPL